MKEVKKQQKKIAIIFSIIITLLILGFCYLLFTNIGHLSNKYSVKDRVLKITFQNGDEISNIKKLSNEDGLASADNSFSIINNGTLAMTYKISLKSPNLASLADSLYISLDGESAQLLSSFEQTDNSYMIAYDVVNATNNENDFKIFKIKMWAAENSTQAITEKIKIEITSAVCMNLATDLLKAKGYTNNSDGLELGNDSLPKYTKTTANNYLLFNDELWRVIGIYNVKTQADGESYERLLIIKNEAINKLPWVINNEKVVLAELDKYSQNILPQAMQHLDLVMWGANKEANYFNLPTTDEYQYMSGWVNKRDGFWIYDINKTKIYAIFNSGIEVPNQNDKINILPTTYLKATTRIIDGDGTIKNPYQID